LDLETLIEEDETSKLSSGKLGEDGVRSLLYQLLSGISCMHKANVVHRNLCPSSILIDQSETQLQIGSFSKAISTATLKDFAPEYKSSDKRFMAPELWCYSHEAIPSHQWTCIDMWSVGCLFAYILGTVLFPIFPGQTANEWLMQVCSIKECRPALEKCEDIPQTSLRDLINFSNEHEYDLLSQLLRYDPQDRLTVSQALMHPYFKSIRQAPGSSPSPRRCTDENILKYFTSLRL